MAAMACQGKDEPKQRLTMATSADFPPFEMVGGAAGEEVVGFDVELGKAIAEKAGLPLVVEDINFSGVLTALESGKADFAISGITSTPERRTAFDFSNPYYEATQTTITRANDNSIRTIEDLHNKRIGVQLGSTGNILARNLTSDANISAFARNTEAIMELMNGKIDAVILDQQPGKHFIEQNQQLRELNLEFEPEYYSVAVKKGNSGLLKTINETIAEVKRDGRYASWMEQWIN